MIQSRHPLYLPLVWLLAAGFGLIACRMDDAGTAGAAAPTLSVSSPVIRQSNDERQIVLLVPEMDNILAARQATRALESLPQILQARASTVRQTVEVATDGPVPVAALIQSLADVGLYAVAESN